MAASFFSEPVWFDTISSTNDYLKQLCAAQPQNGLVAIAREQTAGRGRTGRSFDSKKGRGIYFSFSLTDALPAARIPNLTLLAGLAVFRAIYKLSGLSTEIKWPNDILFQRKKLCGILTEGSVTPEGLLQYAVVGIGINLTGDKADFPPELQKTAVSLAQAGVNLAAEPLVSGVLSEFEQLYAGGAFADQMEQILSEYTAHLAYRGALIRLHRGDEVLVGRLVGVNDLGEVLLLTDGRLEAFSSGELQLRPVRTCAFSGNRQLSHSRDAVYSALLTTLTALIDEGFTYYKAGGAGGFDTLAAKAVLALRAQHPEVFLELILPYPDFAPKDPDFAETLQKADQVTSVCQSYTKFCLAQRNQALVDGSQLLLLYNHQTGGGSVQTAGMAMRAGVEVRQLEL